MKHWIGIFGVMQAVLTDNGGEFTSDEIREVMSILNVRTCTAAGMSPFQRVHAITDCMLTKLEEEYDRKNYPTFLCWAKNSLQMWNGFSSHQLVFGTNPNLPNIMTDKLPALIGSISSEIFAKNLNALHSARKAYIQSESEESIRRALRYKVQKKFSIMGTMFSTSVKEKNGDLDQEKLFSKMEKLYLSGMVVSLYVFRQTDFVKLRTILQDAMLR